MAQTPPPPEIHTPTAPRHGPLFDSPHINNRRSDRIKNQTHERAKRTPSPPYATASFDSEGPGELKRTPKAKRDSSHFLSRPSSARYNLSPPSSSSSSSAHDFTMPPTTRSNRAKMMADLNGVSDAAQAGLPTPASRTARRQILFPHTTEAARALFPQSDLKRAHADSDLVETEQGTSLPTPVSSRKRGKRMRKVVGFSLDDELEQSSGGQGGGIEIYTDSREKIPELDESAENPFYTRPGEVEKKKYADRESAREQHKRVEEYLSADTGYVAVKRGRRFWKKIEKDDSDPEPGSPLHYKSDQPITLAEPSASPPSRRLLRPKRLFVGVGDSADGSDKARREVSNNEIERTGNDIDVANEDPEQHDLLASNASQLEHVGAYDGHEDKKSVEENDGLSTHSSSFVSVSPFDSWTRRKTGKPASVKGDARANGPAAGVKREGEPLSSDSKRVRESR